MNKILKPYQLLGSAFLAANPHALLADEPGLGKTIQAIDATHRLGLRKMLVVCPASVRLGWAQEIEECLGRRALDWNWHIISYNAASKVARESAAHSEYDAIILDEAHFLKTPDSLRTLSIFGNGRGLARRAKYKWALTGTPVLNRPRELYPMLKTLAPAFSSMTYAAFTQRYCGAFFDGRAMNTRGATNLHELAQKLSGFMLRRTKAEVLPQLPPRIVTRVPLMVEAGELDAVHEEERLIENREAKISSVYEDFSQLGDLSRLLRLTGLAKVRAAAAFVIDQLETVDKVVVFARHREVIKQLELAFEARDLGTVVYHGGMSDGQKQDAVNIFRARRECRVFIGQIDAAGTGINGLQDVCSTAVFAELSWVPGSTGQAVDRLHRIGQSANSVNAYLLHMPGTLESAVMGVHDAKTRVIDRLMGVA